MIKVNNLSLVKYRKAEKFYLLHDISFELATQRTTLFLGKSGSGKTLILRCMAQIEKGYTGEITYEGKRIDKFSQKERSQLIGFVSQSYALFPFMTILDNCAHPLRKILGFSRIDAYKRVNEFVHSLGMQDLLHHYPYELSGGQQQRAAIIRALLLNPTFLFLDEPTSALDPENTELLIQIINRLKSEGKGIVISSQDMFFAQRVFEKAYFLEDGRIIETHNAETLNVPIFKQSKLASFLYSRELQPF